MPRSARSRHALAASFGALSALSLCAAGSAGAQAAPRPAPAVPEGYRYTIGASPFLPLAGIVSGEFEVAVPTPGLSFGVGGLADLSGGDDRFSSIQAKLKYYPNEVTLKGFAVGATLGLLSARDEDGGDLICGPIECTVRGSRSETKPTFGVVIDYNWLLGRQKRFLVGAGVGARRVLSKVDERGPLQQTWPDGRLVIGWAF